MLGGRWTTKILPSECYLFIFPTSDREYYVHSALQLRTEQKCFKTEKQLQ